MIIAIITLIVGSFIIVALPLHLAVKLLGGKSTIFKALLINFIIGFVMATIYTFIPFASIITFFVLIWIYREIFQLKWFKAFLTWIIQGTLTFLFILIFSILFKVSLLV